MRDATLAASTPNSGAGDFSRQSWLMCAAAAASTWSGTIQLGSSPVELHCAACRTLYDVVITWSGFGFGFGLGLGLGFGLGLGLGFGFGFGFGFGPDEAWGCA